MQNDTKKGLIDWHQRDGKFGFDDSKATASFLIVMLYIYYLYIKKRLIDLIINI